MRILFVCTGNTCRSPMAQALMQSLSEKKGLSLFCDSAGIYAVPGSDMCRTAKDVLEKVYQISNFDHKAKRVTKEDLDSFDLIVAMTEDHERLLLQAFGVKGKTVTIPGGVGDPFGGNFTVYQKAAEQILEGLLCLVEKGVIHD